MTQNCGKIFEKTFETSVRKAGYFYVRLNDTMSYGNIGNGKSFSVANKCDCILSTNPDIFMSELKSTKQSSMSFDLVGIKSRGKTKGTKGNHIIKTSQVITLLKEQERNIPNVHCGLILNFRPRTLKSGVTENETFYVPIKNFFNYVIMNDKTSINVNDCVTIGLTIPSKLLVTNYEYDVRVLKEVNQYE